MNSAAAIDTLSSSLIVKQTLSLGLIPRNRRSFCAEAETD